MSGGRLAGFFFFVLLGFCSALQSSCSSCHHTSTHGATWKQDPLAAVVTFPLHTSWRDRDLLSAAPDTTTPAPHPFAPTELCGVQAQKLTFELRLLADSSGSLLSSGVATAVLLLCLHYPDRPFALPVLLWTRCSLWRLSSFSEIPLPALASPPSLLSVRKLFIGGFEANQSQYCLEELLLPGKQTIALVSGLISKISQKSIKVNSSLHCYKCNKSCLLFAQFISLEEKEWNFLIHTLYIYIYMYRYI